MESRFDYPDRSRRVDHLILLDRLLNQLVAVGKN